jgi:2-O-methyltransferase
MATPQEQSAIQKILQSIRFQPTIVELGAHCGEDEAWFREACFTDPLHVMVEPDMRNAQYLIDHPKETGQTRRVILGAVSDRDGVAEFHFCRNDRDKNRASGSLRNPTGHRVHFPWITFPFTGMVPTWKLDTIFARERLTKIDLLWVDIQGAERDMIAGATMALARTQYIFMEAETVELYEGEALKPELITLLPGWTLLEDFGCNILLRNERFVEAMR